MAYIQTRQPDKAREALARAFGVDPASAGAHLLAAQMMIRVEFFEMADAELREALALDPAAASRELPARGECDLTAIASRREWPISEGAGAQPGRRDGLYRIGEAWSRQAAWDKAIPRCSDRSG